MSMVAFFPKKSSREHYWVERPPADEPAILYGKPRRECLVITFMDYERRLLFWHPGNDWQDTDQFAEDKIASMEGLLSENFEWTWTPRDLNWWLARRVAA